MDWVQLDGALFSHRFVGSATLNAFQSSQMVNFYDIFSSLSLCIHFGAQNTQSKPFGIRSLHFSVDAYALIGHLQAASLRGQVLAV
jgi:hypothetical protein